MSDKGKSLPRTLPPGDFYKFTNYKSTKKSRCNVDAYLRNPHTETTKGRRLESMERWEGREAQTGHRCSPVARNSWLGWRGEKARRTKHFPWPHRRNIGVTGTGGQLSRTSSENEQCLSQNKGFCWVALHCQARWWCFRQKGGNHRALLMVGLLKLASRYPWSWVQEYIIC